VNVIMTPLTMIPIVLPTLVIRGDDVVRGRERNPIRTKAFFDLIERKISF